MSDLLNYIDFSKQSLLVSACSIAFNPLFWNIVARQEYHNKILTKLFGGQPRTACYALAATIFSLGLVRDWLYKTAISEQATHPLLLTPYSQAAAYTLIAFGNVLVVTSTWALGITGTFLGDYFGILMDEMVTGFPFNVTGAPMYWGSTMSFLGTALLFGKPAGLLLTAEVLLVYIVALRYEDPFTAGIYAKREREREAAKSGKKQK
ncbi:phospholipid methyltransferase-domain-containing protein [Stachybotrys elegans]|uniref:Phosphatidyl-N-methylethanolamine N-methyltransferase n=1 Tax=Stachybotrys elegans TaxID=80388 RepID=A0A8K0SJX6_9HYPO|nr:phospholipid methyltransferase-domain-containing protein [Stachybotrys elegans]